MIVRVDPGAGSSGEVCGDARLRTRDGSLITVAEVVERLHRGSNPRAWAVDIDGSIAPMEIHFARRVGEDVAIIELSTDRAGSLHASANQLVLDSNGAWRAIGGLGVSDQLAMVSGVGSDARIETCQVVAVTKAPPRAVYEFSIRGMHNVVSADGLVIHD